MTKDTSRRSAVFDFFFIRSVPAIVWVLLLVFVGLLAYGSMHKESLPDLEIPEAYVLTRWEGATPLMMEKEVTQKIETQLRGMKGLKKMYSSSKEETSIIAVTFHAECSLEESMQLLNRKVTAAYSHLPNDVERPIIEATSVRDIPIATIALVGDVDRSLLEEQARKIKRRLERIHGIKRAIIVGGRTEIVHVQLLPEKLKAYGIPPTDIRACIKAHGSDSPWGKFEKSDLAFTMKMVGAYTSLEQIENLIVKRSPDGVVVRLRDVASVSHSHLREKTHAALSWQGDGYQPTVAINVLKAPGRDTITLVDKVKDVLTEASSSPLWPLDVEWRLTGDQSEAIWTELDRGFTNGWQAMLAVFIVLFILLTWREALIAAISIPLTLLGALGVLWAMGYTFNLLVIVGMILALGLLVDDFILIMEGMHEGIFIHKLGFVQSVRRTIRTYAIPSFSGSVTTVLVFLPLAFVGGVDGKFIRVIPVSAAVCLVMSYIVSVVLGPVMSKYFFGRGEKNFEPGRVDHISKKVEDALGAWLGRMVVKDKRRALVWLGGAAFLFVFSLYLFANMRDTLYPAEDGRTLGILVELSPDTTLEESALVTQGISDILRRKPYFENIIRVVGGRDSFSFSSFHDYLGRSEAPNLVGFACYLIPGKDRDKLAVDYANELRGELDQALSHLPAARFYLNPATGGATGEDALQIDVTGDDMNSLRNISQEIRNILQRIPGVVDVRDNIGPATTELHFRPMLESMDHYQISQEELAGQMVGYMENEKVAKFRRVGTQDDLDIRLGGWWGSQEGKMAGPKDWKELEQLVIFNKDGQGVPLWSLVEPKMITTENVILHNEGRRSVTVLAKLDGAYVSEMINHMRPVLDNMRQSWPSDYTYRFAGEEDVVETYTNMLKAFLLAIVLVYAILALLFDSMLYPFIILSTVLFALVGVFTGFFIGGIPFSFSAAIGIVALVGIVVNDAIIIVETMRNHRKRGLSIAEAATKGASDRLRPIVSTTVTNFAGLLPLALADPGWAPLCQAIIFGEITATVGAMILIPALYVLLSSRTTRLNLS